MANSHSKEVTFRYVFLIVHRLPEGGTRFENFRNREMALRKVGDKGFGDGLAVPLSTNKSRGLCRRTTHQRWAKFKFSVLGFIYRARSR